MKDTIRKINLLAYPNAKALIDYCPKEPTLEDVLVALELFKSENYCYIETNVFRDKNFRAMFYDINSEFLFYFIWQLTKTLSQQSEETQQTIKQIFEDGK